MSEKSSGFISRPEREPYTSPKRH